MSQQPTQREYWSGKTGDEWARQADRMDATLAPMTKAALDRAAFKAGERAVDIGCGAGATTLAIARAVGPSGAAVGVDISPQLLNAARERASAAALPAQFIEADAGVEKFGDDFDVAFSRFGVMFFEHPAQAFANIRAAMRPGGRLVFLSWRAFEGNEWAMIPVAAIIPMLTAPLALPNPDAPGPYGLSDDAKIKRVLAESGWRDIDVSPWDGPIAMGGGGSVDDAVDFVLRIGPCARAMAEQKLDLNEARRRLTDALAPRHNGAGVIMNAGCWLVTARA
jgi:SAM-dependent methyltransferase